MIDAFAKYKNNTIAISNPAQQLRFIFDESVRLLYVAKKSAEDKNYDLRFKSINKVINSFMLLKQSVIEDENNQDSQTLKDFYIATIFKLEQINISDDANQEIQMMIDAFLQVRNSLKEAATA